MEPGPASTLNPSFQHFSHLSYECLNFLAYFCRNCELQLWMWLNWGGRLDSVQHKGCKESVNAQRNRPKRYTMVIDSKLWLRNVSKYLDLHWWNWISHCKHSARDCKQYTFQDHNFLLHRLYWPWDLKTWAKSFGPFPHWQFSFPTTTCFSRWEGMNRTHRKGKDADGINTLQSSTC